MKLLVTQRELTDAYGEAVDSLEAAYTLYFEKLGMRVQPVPNFLADAGEAFAREAFDGLVLTGGGSLAPCFYREQRGEGGQPHRDRTELALLKLCQKRRIPVLAICRGMQYLNGLWGGKISRLEPLKIPRPIRVDHPVQVAGEEWLVNQYHHDGILLGDLAPGLRPVAVDRENGVVEAFASEREPILGIQWHPERPFARQQAQEKTARLVKQFLTTGDGGL